MGSEIQKAPEITLLRSEMEAAAARVAERAMNTTLDGVGSLVGDVFGGLIGDGIKQWRNRNLVSSLVKTKHHFDRLGIRIEKAKALPMGELYAIFEGMSKQDDPQLSDMWAALLANAMNPSVDFTVDPSLPRVLQQLSGVDAIILKFYNDAAAEREMGESEKTSRSRINYGEEFANYRRFIQSRGGEIVELFGIEVASASISNLLRLGIFFVESEFDDSSSLVDVDIVSNYRVNVNVSQLKEELSGIYYHLNLAYDNVADHKIIHYYVSGAEKRYFLPYDMTRLANRLIQACTEPKA